MWDSTSGHFWTGTERCGDEHREVINKRVHPLDVNTWGILALGETKQYDRAMVWADTACFVGKCPKGCGAGGFDFNNDRDGVWFEGTAQASLAYQFLGERGRSRELLGMIRQASSTGTERALGGIPGACHDGISTGFEWKYYASPHIGATAWHLMAEQEYNPYWGISTSESVPFEGLYE
jgi:hypothetical protein